MSTPTVPWTHLTAGGQTYRIANLAVATRPHPQGHRLPLSLRVLLENALRTGAGGPEGAAAIAGWRPNRAGTQPIAFYPARVLMQDLTGVPAVVDLAALREAMHRLGGDARAVDTVIPVDVVVDHSVQVDFFNSPGAMKLNIQREFARNRERFTLLRWAQRAFRNVRVLPPDIGIVHQLNLECLATIVRTEQRGEGPAVAYAETVVGTDSHTTMVNALGVLGWGMGGLEAEAAMLGQPVSLVLPEVIGVRFTGALPEGTTATDLVLRLTELLNQRGVVGRFVEFAGSGLAGLSLADRATLANMAPEYGATCAFFPIDDETLRYLRLTGRPAEAVELVEKFARAQGLFHHGGADAPDPEFTDVVEIDLDTIEPSLAGPRRPQDRVALKGVPVAFEKALPDLATPAPATPEPSGASQLSHGSVVIAAITSCTTTSNPALLVAAGLLARKAVARGLKSQAWVKTSLAPGSRVAVAYLKEAGLLAPLEALGFHVVGFGCTTCNGNSGPLAPDIAADIDSRRLVVAAVLSGNRNFEGRIHPQVRAAFLASPPLVVAYALTGHVRVNLTSEPLGHDPSGQPVYLRDIWPSSAEIQAAMLASVNPEVFARHQATTSAPDPLWDALPESDAVLYPWSADSTAVRLPPFLAGVSAALPPPLVIQGARVLAMLGDSITTDHISPGGALSPESPAGRYLLERGVPQSDFNTGGAYRGNHEVMMRTTFANPRLKNALVPGTEGGWTRHFPTNECVDLFEASDRYARSQTPLILIAGKDYGNGSSRDWAAKGQQLLGIRAVIATSYARIHLSNLVGVGVLPLEFLEGDSPDSLRLTGEEVYDINELDSALTDRHGLVSVTAHDTAGGKKTFKTRVRLDTQQDIEIFRHGGLLPLALRQLRDLPEKQLVKP